MHTNKTLFEQGFLSPLSPAEGDVQRTPSEEAGGGFVGDTHNWTKAHITDSLLWMNKAGTSLKEGYIALQAESQDVDFRKVELLDFVGCTDPKPKNYSDYYIKSDSSQCKY